MTARERSRTISPLAPRNCPLPLKTVNPSPKRGDSWKKMSKVFGYPSFFALRARNSKRAIRAFFQSERLGLTEADMPAQILRDSVDANEMACLDPLNKTRLLTFNQLYNTVIPTLGDRVEMINSLECRPPFLDRELVEFALRLPARYKTSRRGNGKRLNRGAFQLLLQRFSAHQSSVRDTGCVLTSQRFFSILSLRNLARVPNSP